MSRMTKRKALQVLIHHACRDVAGAGTGIRAAYSEQERAEVTEAVGRMWPDAYTFALDDAARCNLGLPRSRP